MSDEGMRPIVVKRYHRAARPKHGGAWKIAYADFVTAMMAFFLLMWLLGSTTRGDLDGIAEYFKTPLKVAMQGGSGSGDISSVIKGGGTDITLSPEATLIATYALCGFANFSSIAIQIGGIGGLAPERRSDLARFGLRAVLGGSIATFMTATIAGVLTWFGGF